MPCSVGFAQEVRAGKQDLALLLEKEPEGWNAALLAPPAFFGSRNRIPGVALSGNPQPSTIRMLKRTLPTRPTSSPSTAFPPFRMAILPVFRLAGLILAAGTARGASWLP